MRKHIKKPAGKLLALTLGLCMSVASLSGCADYDDDDDYYSDDDDSYDDDDDSYSDNDDSYDDDDDNYNDDDDNYDDDDDSDNGSSSSGSSGSSSKTNLFSSLGSAGEMAGTTVIVSIFPDDKKTSWSSSDSTLKNDCNKFLGIATDWLSDATAQYSCNSKFIYDWTSNSDLVYETTINGDLTNENDMDSCTWEYIEANIDSEAIKNKYNADNIIYMMFINSPESNTNTSCTRNYYDGMEYPYEVCYMYMHCDGEEETPAAFAHEILHTFGAPDLYSADTDGSNYGITEEYVQEMKNTSSNDIMYTTYDANTNKANFNKITNELTEIDAYYVGLTSSSSVVNQWGFKKSQH